MNYFVASGYLEDLEETVTVDALHEDIAIADSISTSKVQSSNADIGILESYLFASPLGFTSNLMSSNVQTTQLNAQNATINNLTFSGASGSNLVVTDLSAGDGNFYNVQTSLLSASNVAFSSVLTNYFYATTILGSNICLLHELIDRSNVSIIDSNGTIDWVRLKNLPESDSGLDIFNMAQSAYDLAQLGYNMYQLLQSLLGNTPSLPNNIKDPIYESLGDSNETSSNSINVAWERVFRRPLARQTIDRNQKRLVSF
jgi:hypothetical protein